MADYADGDEQLQDAFEEGNGDAAHDEVSHSAATDAVCVHPARQRLTLQCSQELASMRARLAQLEDEKKKMEEHTVCQLCSGFVAKRQDCILH